jgi:superfamily II DNA or RNA helicase
MDKIINKSLTNDGYVIRLDKITKSIKDKIKKELRVEPEEHPDYSFSKPNEVDDKKFNVYRETEDYMIVPRYYGVKTFGKPSNDLIDFKEINIQLKQIDIANECLKSIKEDGGGVISLPCGEGKTILAIYLATQLKLKTLVIVHKTFLQNQWCDRISQFTDAKIGIIRQKKKEVDDKDIVIGMLQSISLIDYGQDLFKDFGLIICDECHHFGSRVFSQALSKVCGKYTIGLSATPKRKDGLSKVFMWYLGDMIYKMEKKEDNNVIVKMFDYTSDDVLFKEVKQRNGRKFVPSIPKMITNITNIKKRNTFCVNIINNLRKMDERKILVLSGRLIHLVDMKKKIDEIIKHEIESEDLEPDEIKTSFYIGGMKEYELRSSAEADIIFATYSMAEEGLDIDSLNTLLLATPKKDIIQSIGRIMRKPIKDGDIKPLIVDIKDNFSMFKSWATKRKAYYEQKKYQVESFLSKNDKCQSINDFLIDIKVIQKSEKIKQEKLREIHIKYLHGELGFLIAEENNFKDYPIENYIGTINLNNIFIN